MENLELFTIVYDGNHNMDGLEISSKLFTDKTNAESWAKRHNKNFTIVKLIKT